ncbi:Ephrin type-A receptor 4 [Geodia barretti]|uniref:Ephrin type-A receptor 4 n=1 Tax=Geodia barretti TaxID=519541 RepID=A0AA35TNE3_GEOBA|nr:Ephrin type-A receptor 4 [Geodia barretti]
MRTSYLEMELGTLPIATAVWNDFSFDGNDVTPETLSPTYWQQGAGGICRFQTRVCGWRRNEVIISQNNWLFTQHISQDFDRNDYGYNVEIHVEAIYSLQSCRERQGCIQRFNLLHYMTNSQQLPSTSGNGYMNTQNYENFAVPEGPTSSETYTNTYNFTLPPSSTGFYIAVQDIGSCIALSRLRIYRENCKSFQTGLVLYPDAPAPVSGSANIDISCVENAVVSGSSRVTCGSDGTWGSQNPVCQCRLGYENRQTECIACGAGQYRSSEDTTCQRCPANCETDEVAADESNEAPSAPCTQPPSAPGSLSLSPQQSSITVRWSAPADLGGRRDLYYQVEISDPDNLGSFTGTVFLSGSTTSRTISGLRPHTQYCVRVTAHNGVSDQDPDGEHLRTVEECTTTSEARPGAVSGVQGTYPYVVWNPPEEPNGVITGYRLVFSRSGTSTTRTVTTTNDQTFYIIQSSNIPWTSGDFRVTVAAGNSVGFGTQSSTFTLTIGVLHAHHLRHPTAQVKTHRNSLREERDTNNDNNTLAFTLQAVQDIGSCIALSRLRVYRNNCKSRQVGLVLYPDAPAPVTGSANIDISCVENAVVSGSSRVTCGSDGTWGSQSPVCQCRLGYEERQTECIACGAGQYRSREDTTCQSCPANCETDEVAADECECLVDYDRNNVNRMTATGAQPFLTLPATELPSEKCTQPPSAPRSLSLRPQQSSITVRWSAPADLGGRRDLYYQVEISDPDNLGSYTGTVFLSGSTTSRTISGLRPHTQYCVRVTAHNGVSDQDPDGEHLRTDDDCSRTSEARPGVVSGVQGKYPYVVWNPPEEPNGVITGYRLVFSRSGTSTTRTVTTTNDQTFYIIQSSDVPWTSGEFRVTVAAGNSVGFGTQSSTLTLTIGDSTCRNTTSATQLSRNTMSPNNNRNHMSPNNRVPIHLYSHQRDSTVSYR